MDRKMEKKIIQEIRKSAEELEIPEGLLPENVEARLETLPRKNEGEETGAARPRLTQKGKQSPRHRRIRKMFPALYGISAAALLLVCCYTLFQNGLMAKSGSYDGQDAQNMAMEMDGEAAQTVRGEVDSTGAPQSATQPPEASRTTTGPDEAPRSPETQAVKNDSQQARRFREAKRDAGDLYKVASNYEEVYNLLKQYEIVYETEDGRSVSVYPTEPADNSAFGVDGAFVEKEEIAAGSYSATNTQVAGVDESDIIKTDGVCLYTVKDNKVYITDIRGGELSPLAVLDPTRGEQMGDVQEIYVEEDRLIVIASVYESHLVEYDREETMALREKPMAQVVNDAATVLYTYDTSEKTAPRLLGTIRQDGEYRDSRKIGDMVYLFSWENGLGARLETTKEEDLEWLPTVNGTYISADHIYLSEKGYNALLVSSLDIKHPGRVLDEIMILCDDEIYLTAQSLYLYNGAYMGDAGWVTQIARFALEDGVLNAVGAAMVEGTIKDTFAINEYGESFRVLTTCQRMDDGTVDNTLTLFDLELQKKGTLTGIAPGETIYSARFFENMAYFVTYRNVDPLFAVDLSEESQPKILGELELTGYSEYLHLWGEDKLLGIGFETDPQSGKRLGIKMSMFDLSDPAGLKVLDSVVLKNRYFSPALYQYKTVLASPEEGLIGFAVGDEARSYLVYGWEEDGFRLLLEREWDGDSCSLDQIRGLYVGDMFYIASPNQVVSFDRKGDYREIDALEIGE